MPEPTEPNEIPLISLSLFPIEVLWPGGTEGSSHTVLSVPRDSMLFAAIRALPPTPLPPGHRIVGLLGGFDSRCGRCVGVLDHDCYGQLYTWTLAAELGGLLWAHYPSHPVSAYILALEPESRVVLDWH